MIEGENRFEPADDESVFLDSISQLSEEELKKPEKEQGLLRQEKIKDAYNEISDQFIDDGRPVDNSYVRLDQEGRISDDLNTFRKVLIRGYWRIGKTSTALSVGRHYFTGNSLFLDAGTVGSESLEKFKEQFGRGKVADFITGKEHPTLKWHESFEYQDQIMRHIIESGEEPLVYLNEYLKLRDDEAYLVIDEIIGLVDQAEKMAYLADLDLDHLKLAIVLHRIAEYEPVFSELFHDYHTHFIRSVTETEEHRLLSEPLADSGVSFSSEAQADIYRFSGGRPMEIQGLAKTLTSSTSRFFEAKKVYGAEQTEKITQARPGQLNDYLESAITTYRRIFDRALSDPEKELVVDAAGGKNLAKADRQIVKPLLETLVLVEDSTGGYRLNGELFKKVIQEKINPSIY